MRRAELKTVLQRYQCQIEDAIDRVRIAPRAYLYTGGGIAGNGGVWWLRHDSGVEGPIRTRGDLHRAMLAYFAGPKPPERPGYVRFARLNHNRFGEHYVWCYRPVVRGGGSRPEEGGA